MRRYARTLLMVLLGVAVASIASRGTAQGGGGLDAQPVIVANDLFYVRALWELEGVLQKESSAGNLAASATTQGALQRSCAVLVFSDIPEFVFADKRQATRAVFLQRIEQLLLQPNRLKSAKCVAERFKTVTAADIVAAFRDSVTKPRAPMEAAELFGAGAGSSTGTVVVRGELLKVDGRYRLQSGSQYIPVVVASSAKGLTLCQNANTCTATVYGMIEKRNGRRVLEASGASS